MVEMYYRVRQREQPPLTVGLSVGLGTLIGCQPLYGLHLPLCIGLAKVLRLSGTVAYLASYLNNPLTAPFLLYLEASAGHRIVHGRWLGIDPRTFGEVGGLGLGRDLLLGAAVVGVLLGAALAAVSFLIAVRYRRSPFRARFVNRIAHRYKDLGLRVWEIVRAKLRHDPVYFGILRSAALPDGGRLVDLGCGRGILLATIRTAHELDREELWPHGWPTPPTRLELCGFEVDTAAADAARLALADCASIHNEDLRGAKIPPCEAAALIDVLHYLGGREQEELIERTVGALAPGGLILIREADAGGGLRFLITRMQERLMSWSRLELGRRFRYRSTSEWTGLLERHGLETRVEPMAQGTPFANVLIEARLPGPDARRPGLA